MARKVRMLMLGDTPFTNGMPKDVKWVEVEHADDHVPLVGKRIMAVQRDFMTEKGPALSVCKDYNRCTFCGYAISQAESLHAKRWHLFFTEAEYLERKNAK